MGPFRIVRDPAMPRSPLTGLHHISAMTADIEKNRDFYTRLLGLRLVKKTVNQDDAGVYHLFYADGAGSAGTDVTFFAFPNLINGRSSRGDIAEIALRIHGDEAFAYWTARFAQFGVPFEEGAPISGHRHLTFTDPEGQRFAFIDDSDAVIAPGTPWDAATVPQEFGIRGLGAVTLTAPRIEATLQTLTDVLGFRVISDETVGDDRTTTLETGPGGVGSYLVITSGPNIGMARTGMGGVHHIAFRVPLKEDHREWHDHLGEQGVRVTEEIDRFYFLAMYFREPGGVLFEISTDGPGFATDEPQVSLGESLALPPFLESFRSAIEQNLTPLDTRRAVTTTEYGQDLPSA